MMQLEMSLEDAGGCGVWCEAVQRGTRGYVEPVGFFVSPQASTQKLQYSYMFPADRVSPVPPAKGNLMLPWDGA